MDHIYIGDQPGSRLAFAIAKAVVIAMAITVVAWIVTQYALDLLGPPAL